MSTITVVESRVHQSYYEHLERGCRQRSVDLAQLSESSEALRRYQKLTAAAAAKSIDQCCGSGTVAELL